MSYLKVGTNERFMRQMNISDRILDILEKHTYVDNDEGKFNFHYVDASASIADLFERLLLEVVDNIENAIPQKQHNYETDLQYCYGFNDAIEKQLSGIKNMRDRIKSAK